MSPDPEALLAYVDGELPPQRRAAVEAAIAADPALAAMAAHLQASRLPYFQAFAQQAAVPVPPTLTAHVDALLAPPGAAPAPAFLGALAGSAASAAAALAATVAAAASLASLASAASVASVASAATVAATVAASGGLSGASAVAGHGPAAAPDRRGAGPSSLWWTGLGMLLSLFAGLAAATWLQPSAPPLADPWVRKVASYHAMYARETVQDGESAGQISTQALPTQALLRRLQQQGLSLRIPDLSGQGLQFVRAQQLQFEGRPVLQLVYLPRRGLPVAVCLMPATAQAEQAVQVDGQHALTWFANGWAYVLIGSLPAPDMQQIRRSLPTALL